MADSPLHQVNRMGQSAWADFLSRDLVRGGGLARIVAEDAIVGLTSNPSIFEKALASGSAYDEQLREVIATGETSDKEVFVALGSTDIREACDVLRPVWEQTGGRDGYVSFEVDPRLAYDVEGTIAEAVRLHALIERPNLMVKIPATKPGLAAIEEMIAKGKSINVTLIFSLQRYTEVVESYLRGLERLVAHGGDPSNVQSVASFFVSRVDTEADRRIEAVGGPDDLKGTLAIANAKLAYEHFLWAFSGERWEFLASKGASTQRCLWASTSTKNPAYRDVVYVEQLIGPDTVNTMPEETVRAFQDHGVAAPTLATGFDEARRVLERFAEAGIDYDDVTETLEAEGVEKFEASFRELLGGIASKRASALAA